ncbi:MAG: Hpt domain-containing protein [Eubacterium sp.]|jgi:HPt (histidine-containing phosphotransfer) domain-containing protein|nr:Hpt domain-containing protein [Eubacterium sp.]
MWDLSIIDLDEALNRVMGRKDMYVRWLDKFFLPETIAELEDVFKKRDIKAANAVLHKLKGTAANLAVTSVTEQTARLYERVKSGETDFVSMEEDYNAIIGAFHKASNMYLSNRSYISEY